MIYEIRPYTINVADEEIEKLKDEDLKMKEEKATQERRAEEAERRR